MRFEALVVQQQAILFSPIFFANPCRLPSSLIIINRHEYDLSPILAELPKDSKVASKIMNFAVDITKDLMQEKVDLMEKLMQEKEREKVELSKHITNLEIDVQQRTELLLRSKGMCNMRGALEFIRSMVAFCIFVYVFCNNFYHILFTYFFSLDRFSHRTKLSRFANLQIMF